MSRSFCCALLLASLFVVESLPAAEPGWTQWRGPNRDAQLPDGSELPASLDGLEQVWRVPLGPSYSGPLVTPDRVFVTESRLDDKSEALHALDRATGEKLWTAAWKGFMNVPFFALSNGNWIRSTPAFDGERVYVAGMQDRLVCVDAKSGEILWDVDFMSQFMTKEPAFGFVASPIVLGDYVYVQAGASFAKLERTTGKVVWRVLQKEGGMMDSAFSSPTYAELHGTPMLLVQTRQALCGVDPDSGKIYFSKSIEAFRDMNILTPLVLGNRVFTSTYGGGSFLLEVNKEGDDFTVEQVWRNKVQGYMSSPVLIGEHIYMHLRNGRCVCLNPATGEDEWISKPFGKYWSMVASGSRVLALDERGELYVVEASPEEFQLTSTKEVSESGTWAHLAVDSNDIFVRELDAMTVWKW